MILENPPRQEGFTRMSPPHPWWWLSCPHLFLRDLERLTRSIVAGDVPMVLGLILITVNR